MQMAWQSKDNQSAEDFVPPTQFECDTDCTSFSHINQRRYAAWKIQREP